MSKIALPSADIVVTLVCKYVLRISVTQLENIIGVFIILRYLTTILK